MERTTVHISDDTGRIAMLEHRTIGTAADDNYTAEPLKRFIYSNHLQSASLELDEDAAVISYEEYHPYGTTAYQANNSDINAVAKRYRYTGKERDEESGLYYHGARYYIPWLCRWTACDPMQSEMPIWSCYCYGFCNPITYNDPSGMVPGDGNKPMVVEALGFSTFSSVPTNDNASVVQRPQIDGGFVTDNRGSNINPIVLEDVSIVDNTKVEARYPGNLSILSGPLAEFASANPKEYKDNLALDITSASTPTLSQGRAEYEYEKQARREREYNNMMLLASQDNPLIGTFHFAAADVTGTMDMANNAYGSFSDGKYVKGTAYAGLTLLGISGYSGGISKNLGRAGNLLSEAKLAKAINNLRNGEEISVNNIEHARQILHNMDELTPHVDRFPSNAGEIFKDVPWMKEQKLWKQPKGTYRGDLFPLSEGLYKKGIIHDGGNPIHDFNPHYNILFQNGTKAAIIIKP